MRTRVRLIFTLWLAIGASILAALAVYSLRPDTAFGVAFAVSLLEMIGFFAIWRTQPTFRRIANWLTGGRWPRGT